MYEKDPDNMVQNAICMYVNGNSVAGGTVCNKTGCSVVELVSKNVS